MKLYKFSLLLIFTALLSCHSSKTTVQNKKNMERTILFTPGPQAIIYKTQKDYSKNVPVTMNKERTQIVSYPAPTDIYYRGELSYPTPLKDGYLLDNRGIGINVAFLSYTYEEYSKLKTAPSMDELKEQIIDFYPLTELWNCGIRSQYKNEVKELNELIDQGFKGCKKIGMITPVLPKTSHH